MYAARANLKPVIVSGYDRGGQLMTTTDVDNWPADHLGVQGPDLMLRFQLHAERFGTQFIGDQVRVAELNVRPFRLEGDRDVYTCDALIVATGASALYLESASEQAYRGKGVSGCATCDRFFYKDQAVAVIGGGNIAVEEALYLTDIASHVMVVHRRDRFRAEPILVDRLMERVRDGKVSIRWNHVVADVVGDGAAVTGLRLQNVDDGSLVHESVDGVFIAIGHRPNTGLFAGQLEMKGGYIVTRGGSDGYATQTSISGVFACGDVQGHVYCQAVTSAGSGCMAALDAKRYLDEPG